MARTPRQDAAKAWIRALDAITVLDQDPTPTLPGLLDALGERFGGAPALVGAGHTLTYRALAEQARRHAAWALQQDIAPGQVVALLLPNSPDYAALWLGLTQAGCVAALLNTSLAGAALAHGIRAAGATRLIIAAALLDRLPAILEHLPDLACWTHGEANDDDAAPPRMDAAGTAAPAIPLSRQPAAGDVALLIYTSGTTGLPKAARITHRRLVEWSFWFAGMMDARPNDRLYNCLPMYHSTGGVVAIGAMLVSGGAVVIRERFSASRFWDDIVANECTIFQYIGELCRYLLQSPPATNENRHRLRLCCGNGLRGDVWEPFQHRFQIPKILEFYAATEGNFSLYNCEGKPGAIGRVPGYLTHRFAIALIQCDPVTGEPLRDEAGFCRPCAADQPGEAIGKIAGSSQALSQFDGYTDPAASSRKVLHDVFAAGDRWFRTGDLLRKDAAGYYYFVDRLGDTFRWKGENVATTEVEAVIMACPGVTGAAVYGVEIPGNEGRAGMAAITTGAAFRHAALQAHLIANLPAYARPLFIRVRPALAVTGTFKLQKAALALQGYAANSEGDPVWRYDYETGTVSQ